MKIKKLTLNRETLRGLSERDLESVKGREPKPLYVTYPCVTDGCQTAVGGACPP